MANKDCSAGIADRTSTHSILLRSARLNLPSLTDPRGRATLTLPARALVTRTAQAPVITDGHNPLNRLELPIAEEHGEAMNKLLPIAVWIR
ncbi:MAG: hypothetical protein JWN04_1374 [Myxococcaceae bacterium]|nr:hypothetical protein [Myxococcaceae bacterium]